MYPSCAGNTSLQPVVVVVVAEGAEGLGTSVPPEGLGLYDAPCGEEQNDKTRHKMPTKKPQLDRNINLTQKSLLNWFSYNTAIKFHVGQVEARHAASRAGMTP